MVTAPWTGREGVSSPCWGHGLRDSELPSGAFSSYLSPTLCEGLADTSGAGRTFCWLKPKRTENQSFTPTAAPSPRPCLPGPRWRRAALPGPSRSQAERVEGEVGSDSRESRGHAPSQQGAGRVVTTQAVAFPCDCDSYLEKEGRLLSGDRAGGTIGTPSGWPPAVLQDILSAQDLDVTRQSRGAGRSRSRAAACEPAAWALQIGWFRPPTLFLFEVA